MSENSENCRLSFYSTNTPEQNDIQFSWCQIIATYFHIWEANSNSDVHIAWVYNDRPDIWYKGLKGLKISGLHCLSTKPNARLFIITIKLMIKNE